MKKNRKRSNSSLESTEEGVLLVCLLTVLNFRNKSVGDKIIDGKKIVNKMRNNLYFLNPVPSLNSTEASIDALAVAEKNMNGSRLARIQRDARLEEMTSKLQLLRCYVETTAAGNREIVASSGFDVRKDGSRVGLLPFPANFIAINTRVSGQIILKWMAVKKRTNYMIQYTLDPDSNSYQGASATKTKLILNDLPEGVRFYFRISTNSTAGNGGYGPWISCRPN